RMAVMRDGRIRQLGAPNSVYNAPEDLFVATFIGSGSVGINQLQVPPEGANLKGNGFLLPTPATIASGAGRDLILAIRPEEAEIVGVGAEENSGFDGHIVSEMPMGHVTLVQVCINGTGTEDGPVIRVLQRGH